MRHKLLRQPTNDISMTSQRSPNAHTQISITTISPFVFKMIIIQREYTWNKKEGVCKYTQVNLFF